MFTASNIADFLACQHLMALDRAAALGEIKKPFFNDPSVDLLRELGLKHERRYLLELREARGLQVVEIPSSDDAAEQTVEALRQGADAVYQAVPQQGPWYGRADFLIRVGQASNFGSWSYEVVETKLASSTKARAVVQLCFYSDLLALIQGSEPLWMHVVLGRTDKPESLAVQRYVAYFRYLRKQFEATYRADGRTYPEPVEQCDVCTWYRVCDARWRNDDALCLVAGITRNQRKALSGCGVNTVAGLCSLALPANPVIDGIGETALVRIREQARLQVKGRESGRIVYELLTPVEPDRGLAVLPAPSPGDIFLDFEGDPYSLDGEGLEYLIGAVTADEGSGGSPEYRAIWSLDRVSEKDAFAQFMSEVMERRRQDPGMHIYHYAPYEPTAIKHLAGRHGIFIDELDAILRARVFVDFRVARQGLRASVESYSIKSLEPLYNFQRSLDLRDATLALKAFETVLALGGGQTDVHAVLNKIEGYNRDDCLSALKLRGWLEARRHELEVSTGQGVPRPEQRKAEPTEDLSAYLQQVRADGPAYGWIALRPGQLDL